MELSAIILAGGKSSRMGREKGLSIYKQKSMVEYAIKLAKSFCSECILVANNPGYEGFNAKLVADVYPNKGPLGGIYSGMKQSKAEQFLVLPCDMPELKASVIARLLKSHKTEVSIAKQGGRLHPLVGIYNKVILDRLESCLESDNLAVMSLLDQCHIEILSFDDGYTEFFKNVNHAKDLEE